MIPQTNRPVRAVGVPLPSRLTLPLCLLLATGLGAVGPLRAQSVAEVQVTPETMTLAVGERQTLFATAYDQQGNLIANARFTFWSSDTLVVKVGKEGAVVGVNPGLAKVEARVQGRRATTAMLVTGAGASPAASTSSQGTVLTLVPGTTMLLPGEAAILQANGTLADGSAAPVGTLTWKSLQPEVATVDSSGRVIGVAAGRTMIQATTRGGLMATASVEVAVAELSLSKVRLVLGPEELDTLRVLVPGQGNREIRTGIRWQTTDSSVAGVSPTGVVTARAPGRAEVLAVGFGQEGRIGILVHRDPSAFVVSPRTAAGALQLPLRTARRVTAFAEAGDSTPIPEARVTWEVGDSAIIGYDAVKSELTGRGLGTTTLTARLYGFEPAVWTVQVIPGTLGLDRRRLGLGVGERDSLTATLLDPQGGPLGPAPAGEMRWTSDRPEVLRASPGGILDGIRPGRAVVTAAAPWGKTVTADVFVVADLLLASNRSGRFGIYQMRSNVPDTLRPILSDSAGNVQPALSPDRTRIAFSSNRSGSYDLYLMDADGGSPRRLTTDPGIEGEPVWTPDGSRIVFTATPADGLPQIWSLRPDGKPAQALTALPGGNQSPAVSADGRTLAFVSTRDGNQEIYLMPIEGGAARRVTRTEQRESSPRFLPGGDLMFVTERDRSKGSRVVRLTGTAGEVATVVETEEPIAGIATSRDGRRMAYVVGRLADAGKSKAKFGLFVQSLDPGSTPSAVALRPGEHTLSPTF